MFSVFLIVNNYIIVVSLSLQFDSDLCRYMATIEAITPAGYIVIYDEWGNKEEVGGKACVTVVLCFISCYSIMIFTIVKK